jgi:hypothetical protein
MKRLLVVVGVVILFVLGASGTSAAPPSPVTVELLNPPKKGVLKLAVGESYTFDIEITSSETFITAIALGDEYYPGRGIFFAGNDTAHQTTSAVLHLKVTGKEPTDFLPEGVCPIAVVAGVRFRGGVVFSERFDMNVLVY